MPGANRRALLRLLPKVLTAELDPRTLQRLPAAHIDPGLHRRHADMPRRIACRPAPGCPPRPPVLLTLEFQATVDRRMALTPAAARPCGPGEPKRNLAKPQTGFRHP